MTGAAGASGAVGAKAVVVVPAVNAREVIYEAAPAWVRPAPAASPTAPPAEAPLKVNYIDSQARIAALGNDVYTAYSLTILKPEGLAAGNVALTWNPAGGSASVHHVRIIRAGTASDVLTANRFQTIQRESGLEAARIDGLLTAALQVPGLRVGDTLEVAMTVHNADPTLGAHAALNAMMPQAGATGAYRTELSWPETRAIKWQATADLGTLVPVSEGGYKRLIVELRDPASPRGADGAPLRYNLHRAFQISEYAGWEDVSRAMFPLFDHAAQLEAASPLKAEIARIAAASADPAERARLALKLVQDDVRYVYVGLNGGNYRPMMADEAWGQRLGDCKAKTVVLLALLTGLGIAAEPMLVPSVGGDNADLFLPSPDPFDHVIVRADIAGKRYFLDGTRTGDARLEPFQPPAFRYALPLRAAGAPLERIAAQQPRGPLMIETIDLDYAAARPRATDAPVAVHQYLRGENALVMRAQLAALSPADAQSGLRAYWRANDSWVEPAKMGWSYDDASGTLKLDLTGTGLKVAAAQGTRNEITVPQFTLAAPDERKRPPDQDAGARRGSRGFPSTAASSQTSICHQRAAPRGGSKSRQVSTAFWPGCAMCAVPICATE